MTKTYVQFLILTEEKKGTVSLIFVVVQPLLIQVA
jgi:hypothetical protein